MGKDFIQKYSSQLMLLKNMTIINNPKFPEIKTEFLKKPEFNKLKFFHLKLPLLFKISVDKQNKFY